ncbi:MAG TPA: hypothetical protein HPP77_06075, partial [Candidatus Hydrogenedentes bacterium]|nr:hypothetical protein [Candidatus Hydrogenedentota bacterium]
MWLWVVLLFLAGMALILAEFFIPGGICGVLGGILVITSCGLGCWLAGDGAFWVVLAEGLGVVIVIAAGMLIMSRTRAGRFMILDATQDAAQGWVAWETDESLV